MKTSWAGSLWGRRAGRLIAGDLLVIALCIAAAVASFAAAGRARVQPGSFSVEVSGRPDLTVGVEMTGTKDVIGPLGTTRIEFRDGQARILASPCPLKLCQRAGWIGAGGEVVVCLPNEVVLRVSGNPPDGIDAFSR